MGIAHNIGDLLTYYILTEDRKNVVLARSVIRRSDARPNLRRLHKDYDPQQLIADETRIANNHYLPSTGEFHLRKNAPDSG